jgi:beta-lactamase superfamily II metal-dependent hydrolase
VELDEWNEFLDHVAFFRSRGTKVFTPFRQSDFSKPWWTVAGVDFWILGPKKETANSETREIHDACLVMRLVANARNALITGDASDTNLQDVSKVIKRKGDILRASHHGSINGADLEFIKAASPIYTVISTKEGEFSNVPHPTALARYKAYTAQEVYRTDVSGNLYFEF